MKIKSGHIYLIAAVLFAVWLHYPVGAHVRKSIPRVTATCVETGLTEGKECVLCGKVISEQKIIPATGLHVYDDDFDHSCNDCSYVRENNCSFAVVNHRIVLHDANENHNNLRVDVYCLGDKTAESLTDEQALTGIASEVKTYWGITSINKVLLTDPGNYVALLKYNVGDDAEIKIPVAVTVADEPKLLVDDDNKITVIDEDPANQNHTLTVYYMADAAITDLSDETAVKNAAISSKTYTDIAEMNQAVITRGGNYAFYLRYDNADGINQTITLAEKLASRPVLHVDRENRVTISCEDEEITNLRAYVYYFADQAELDAYNETSIGEWTGEPVAYWDLENVDDATLNKAGNYVIHLQYKIEPGYEKTIVVRVTI